MTRKGCTRLAGSPGPERKAPLFRFRKPGGSFRRKLLDHKATAREPSTSGQISMLQDSEIGTITTGGPFGHPADSKYEKLISFAKEVPPASTVIAHPCDETS